MLAVATRPCIFLEDGSFLASGFRRSRACTHFFCTKCGRIFAQVLVEDSMEHYTRHGVCPPCFERAEYPDLAAYQATLHDFGYLEEPTDVPIEVLQRDFLVLSTRLTGMP